MATYDPKAKYYAKEKIRRTASCVTALSAKATGTVYIEPAELDTKGNPTGIYDTFTMADRTPEQIQMLVEEMGVIAPVPTAEK